MSFQACMKVLVAHVEGVINSFPTTPYFSMMIFQLINISNRLIPTRQL
jgi:hypothetical protein